VGGLAALSQFDPSRSSAAKFAVITMQLSFNDVVGYGPRLEGSYEATQIYYCSRRRSRMAACGAGAGTGADLSSGLLAAGYARYAAIAKGEEIAAAIDSAQASGALNILSSPLFYAHRHLIMERAAAAHLPTIYQFPEIAEEGGFAAYGPRLRQLLAHPDFDVRKSLRDLSTLAQVREALTTRFLTGPAYATRDMNNREVVAAYARVAGPGWLVFVELPIEEWTKY
jgi:hypothetical protein